MDLFSEFQQSQLCFFVAVQKRCKKKKKKYDINHVGLTPFKSQRGFTVDDRRARRCRSQGSVWFCTRSFYHHSTVVTPSSSPPSRHGNLSVCVCVCLSVWENKGGWMWFRANPYHHSSTHTHTHTLPAALPSDGILMPICFQLSPFMRCGNRRLLMVNSDILEITFYRTLPPLSPSVSLNMASRLSLRLNLVTHIIFW